VQVSVAGPDTEASADVIELGGEPNEWFTTGSNEYLVIRDFPAGTTFKAFAAAVQEGQGAACGLQPVQRVVSYWDEAAARSYCIYRAASGDILRDAFTWLGLPGASIYGIEVAG
jgi:hypothetical protein